MQNTRCEIRNKYRCKAFSPLEVSLVGNMPCVRRGLLKGFTLIETVTALVILAIISSSVLVVINRCMASAANSALRMQAFEVARENMEKLLASDSVEETVESGSSDKYPEIKWETTVESFYEPITERMWIRGVCSAEYEDSESEVQTIELTHWLTDLTKQQVLDILQRKEEEKEQLLANELLTTIEEAAEYAGVDVEIIEQWLDDGLLTTEDGSFVISNLNLYKQTGGNPSMEEKQQQVQSEDELVEMAKQQQQQQQAELGEQEAADAQDWLEQIDPVTGLTNRALEEMSFAEIWELVMKRKREGM